MESLSRPFHTRKLSNASSFSGKNAYDGVFSGHRHRYAGAPGPNVHDYREIFGSSQAASSIPVLDLSTMETAADASNLNLRSTEPDYSKIFGGFRDEDVAVSYEELFTGDKARVPSSTRPTSQDLDNLANQSSDAVKQVNMSYHKISQRSKDGLDGTTHVTRLHAVPGFTCFIDETAPPQQIEAKKHKSSAHHISVGSGNEGFLKKQPSGSAINKHHHHESFSEDKFFKTFEINLKSHPSAVSSPSASPTNVDNHEKHPKISTAMNSGPCKTDTSESAPGGFSPTYFDGELDVNSAAAASAAALKEAIEKAQESIRIAKESVGRKKKGLRSFSSKSFKDSLKVEGRMKDVTACEEQKGKDDEVRGVFEKVGAASQVFPDTGKNRKYGGTVIFPDFMDGEKLFIAKKGIDEIHGKISESTEKRVFPRRSSNEFNDNMIVSNSTQATGEIESGNLESAGKHEYATWSSEAVGIEKSRTANLAVEQADQRNSMSVDDYEGKVKVTKTTAGILEHHGVLQDVEPVEKNCELEEVGKQDDVRIAREWEEGANTVKSACFLQECRENGSYAAPREEEASVQRPKGFLVHESCDKKLGDSEETAEIHKSRESKENKDEVRLSDAYKFVKGMNNLTVSQKVEDEKKASQGANQNDCEKRLNGTRGFSENEKQEEVLEQEYIEKVEKAGRHRKKSDEEASEKGLKEGSQWHESENESKDDHSTESHREEEIDEMFYEVCELEMSESTENCDNIREESEVDLQDDCEMKQEDNLMGERNGIILDEACDQEFDENSSSDDNDMEESESGHASHVARNIITDAEESCKADINDNNVETTQEVDDVRDSSVNVTGASCEFQVENTEAMKTPDMLQEEDLFENTSIDQIASDDSEDECEVKSDNLADPGSADADFRQNKTEENDVQSESSSGTINDVEIEADESKKQANIIDEEEIVFREEGGSNIEPSHKEIISSEEPQALNEAEKTMDFSEEIRTSQNREKEDQIGETGPSKVAGKEYPRGIDEVTAREREREKNRLAVDRAIREARERAFAEARERAERAAVEKATAEVRQRIMADAREKIAKASVGTKSSSERTSAESKLRAERAAVERATSEARQRALEKAMSQKSISAAGIQANRESSSSVHSSNGTNTESALRSKAKLEKHNRIMERAAKALAEKEKRDLLAQKEQAERNRLAENLDADIKRWSNGKEKNLRALLSTLQYILGPDSGWQPVSLTEIITNSAVKKAYRKATLCVHPDKLQQRGASIQHKYICEKVFDLLKAAWNRFNSEER